MLTPPVLHPAPRDRKTASVLPRPREALPRALPARSRPAGLVSPVGGAGAVDIVASLRGWAMAVQKCPWMEDVDEQA